MDMTHHHHAAHDHVNTQQPQESGHHHSHHEHMVEDFKKRFWVSIILTIPILLLSPMIQSFLGFGNLLRFPGDIWILFTLSSILFFYGGWPFLKGLYQELRGFTPGMMTLIAIAITVAYVYSATVVFGLKGEVFFWELATLIDIMLLGHWIEMRSVMGAGKALEELARLMPSEAHKVTLEGIINIPVNQLIPSDVVLVKPGEKIPADGVIVKGESSVNESMLTGESKLIYKKPSDQVIGGSVNGEGSIQVSVQKTGKDSFLSQVIKLVKEAQDSKSKTQNIANRAAFWLTIIALTAGAITLFAWLAFSNVNFAFALERTVTVMVITCPHALGLAVPLVVAVSTALGAQHGLLIRNRNAFENARKINAVIFDKTGTLTKGKFGVTDIIVLDDSPFSKEEILSYAASLESHSEHPIAKGITAETQTIWEVEDFKAIPGKGALGTVKGKKIQVVSPGYLEEQTISFHHEQIPKLMHEGKTVIFVIIDNQVSGAIALADIIRPESKETIRKLKEMDIWCIMLTGDNKQVARWVAEEINLDEFFAEVLPAEKVAKVKEIQQRGYIVAMAGDGINDAPALAQADVGIAIGAGTDVAIETADVILVRSNPLDVVAIIKLASSTTRKMIQNLFWATGYNAFAIPIAAGVLYRYGILLSPAVGAVLMSLSTVIVAINARLLKLKV